MPNPQHFKQEFQRARRKGLWFGAAVPGLLLIGALLCALSSQPWFFPLGLVVGAAACVFFGARAYRCPSCGAFPEPDVPFFNPEACCVCKTALR